jgi:O-antigen/teichoic acid export membrane protein
MLNRLIPTRLLKLFSFAVGDQVLLSAANFAVGFGLIRFTSDHDYGLYVLVQSAQQALTGFQRAWLSGPLLIVSARRKSPEERVATVSAVRNSQRRTLWWAMLAAELLTFSAYLAGLTSGFTTLLLAGAVLGSWTTLHREFLRDILLLNSLPQSLLAADAVFVALLVLGAGLAIVVHNSAVLWVTATVFVAALVGAAIADRRLAISPGWTDADAGPVLREMRPLGIWAMVGSLAFWAYSQSSNYLLAGVVDLKAVADVNATRLMLMPAIVLSIGVQSLLLPTAAKWNAEMGFSRLMNRLFAFIAGVGFLDLLYVAVIWISRNWIAGTVLHKDIAKLDQLLILWALVTLIGLLRDVLQSALFALGQLKSLAWQTSFCAAAGVLVSWFGLAWWGAPAVLIGQIVAELLNIGGVLLLLRQAYRSSSV